MELRYIKLKTGYSDDGPAWIGNVKISRSGKTIYFNDHAFQRYNGISGNYLDVESGEEYWISGVKKDGTDRHCVGNGKIIIDKKVIGEYLASVNADTLDTSNFVIKEINDVFPVERVMNLLNEGRTQNN